MNLLLRPLYGLHRLGLRLRHWCLSRFTPAGVAVLCALVAATVLGPDTDNNVAYQALALLLGLMVVATACVWTFLGSFSAQRLLPRFGTVGCPLSYAVQVKNLSAKNQAGLTLIEELADSSPSFREWRAAHAAERKHLRSFRFSARPRPDPFKSVTVKEVVVPTVTPQEDVQVRLQLTPIRRGMLEFKAVRLARPDPLGLVRAFAKVPLRQSTLILPRRYALPPLSFPGTLKYQDGGVALASNVGQSEEFVALRDYRHGDPLRHIHWRTWAKAGKPVVKEFEDEFFVRHALVLDTFTSDPNSEVFEEAVSVAASFACAIQTQESLLDLLFVGPQTYRFTAGRGLAHTDQMLEVLASVRPCDNQSFDALEHLVLNHITAVSGCLCVFLAWDKPRREFVEKIKRLNIPLLVLVIVEPGGAALEPGPMSDDPGKFLVLELGRIEQDLAKLT